MGGERRMKGGRRGKNKVGGKGRLKARKRGKNEGWEEREE